MRFSNHLAALACAALCLSPAHAAKPRKPAAPVESAEEAADPFNERNKAMFTFMLLSRMVLKLQDECRTRHPELQENVIQAYESSIFGKTSLHIDVKINDTTLVDLGTLDRWVVSMMQDKDFKLDSPQFAVSCADFSSVITMLLTTMPQSALDEIASMKK